MENQIMGVWNHHPFCPFKKREQVYALFHYSCLFSAPLLNYTYVRSKELYVLQISYLTHVFLKNEFLNIDDPVQLTVS